MSEAAIFLAQTRYVVNRNIQIVVTQQGTATGHFSTCSYLTGYSVRLLLRKRVLHHCTHLGAKTCGRIQFDRCCLVTRLHKVKNLRPTSMFTLSVWTGPLAFSTLTVAGIVAGAPGSPKLSYASERTTAVNWTPPESSGGGRGTTRRRARVGPPPGASWSMKTEYAPERITTS